MKKLLCILLSAVMLLALAGCKENNKNKPQNPEQTVETESQGRSVSSGNVDIDLTKLSSTMVYSEVYNMVSSPEKYIGKTVKMRGQFTAYEPVDEKGNKTGMIYFSCLIADATACCQQGLEFLLADNPKYPDEYPEEGAEITVEGEFETYMEGTDEYYRLKNAKLV